MADLATTTGHGGARTFFSILVLSLGVLLGGCGKKKPGATVDSGTPMDMVAEHATDATDGGGDGRDGNVSGDGPIEADASGTDADASGDGGDAATLLPTDGAAETVADAPVEMALTPCPNDGPPLEVLCNAYCSMLDAVCTGSDQQYDSIEMCADICMAPTWSCGTMTDTTGNTLFCRANHARNAADSPADAATECPLAGRNSTACR